MAGNLLNQLFRGGSGPFGEPVHTNTHTYVRTHTQRRARTDEAAKDTDCGDADWPSGKKKVDSDVGIWDLGSKTEKQFVLVDMAESFINTWLTRTLLGLMP